ncbi:hypothetical protein Lal_00045463 [Lupinus albus]|nr:hypothetical protein Lal_00045463 [Lupinus albus]
MWESIILTVAATAGNNIGKILQKKGTIILPPLSFKLKIIRTYALNKTWLIGFLMDIFGALLMLRALSLAPVSVIQPVSGCGLAILSIFSHFYLKEVMNVVDWVGITLAGFGTIGVGAGGEEQEAVALSIFHIPSLAFVVFILFVVTALTCCPSSFLLLILLNGWLRICKRERREQEMMEYDVVEEIIYGLESGILFGSFLKTSVGTEELRVHKYIPSPYDVVCNIKDGISIPRARFSQTVGSSVHHDQCVLQRYRLLLPGTGMIKRPSQQLSYPCFDLYNRTTRGLKHGRAIVVSTCAAVASILTGVLAGMLALGERLPSAPKARLALLLGWLLIIVGVILLVGSTRLVRFLTCSSRFSKRTNVDKNYGSRRPGSSRAREPSPSAVIQAATLNHLLSSSSKEKA